MADYNESARLRGASSSWGWILLLLAVVLAGIVAWSLYSATNGGIFGTITDTQNSTTNTNTENNVASGGATSTSVQGVGGAAATTTISEIMGNAVAMTGNMVTVRGEVQRVLGTRTFILDEPGAIADQILVMASDSVSFEQGKEVVVKGVVRTITIVDFERESGVDLPLELEADFGQKPIIVAESVVSEN